MARSLVRAVLGAAMLLAGCTDSSDGSFGPNTSSGSPDAGTSEPRPEGGGISLDSGSREDLGAACDETRSVSSDGSALLVRDPAALSSVTLERVLAQLIATAGGSSAPQELLKRLFDSINTRQMGVFADNFHCDDVDRGFPNARVIDCPRAEGKLASSASLLKSDAPDSFVPVAIVNRFDLARRAFRTCGEYRVVFAKQSGRTDPMNRLMMIFEGVLPNPRAGIAGCRPVTEFWAGLDALAEPADRAARLEEFLFDGLPGFAPLISRKALRARVLPQSRAVRVLPLGPGGVRQLPRRAAGHGHRAPGESRVPRQVRVPARRPRRQGGGARFARGHRQPHDDDRRAWASSAGASAASRPRASCSASPSTCSCRRSSA